MTGRFHYFTSSLNLPSVIRGRHPLAIEIKGFIQAVLMAHTTSPPHGYSSRELHQVRVSDVIFKADGFVQRSYQVQEITLQ